MQSSSPFGRINGVDLYKTFRGAMVFLAGYVLVALANKVSADISGGQIDLGQFSAFQASSLR